MIIIELTQGQTTLIDDIDADLAELNWYAQYDKHTGGYYAVRNGNTPTGRTQVRMHRVILERVLGRQLLHEEQVDHVHHVTTDNRRSEIRLATYSQNIRNGKKRVTNTSGYIGVSYNNKNGNWRAKIGVHRKTLNIGSYKSAEEAAMAYDKKAKEINGEFAVLNFPE